MMPIQRKKNLETSRFSMCKNAVLILVSTYCLTMYGKLKLIFSVNKKKKINKQNNFNFFNIAV